MLHRKTLLIAFFLSLFILQQAHASARFLPNKEDVPHVDLRQANVLPTQLYIIVAHLDERTNYPVYDANNEIVKCFWGDLAYGCGEAGSGYPYDDNPVWVDVENDYLLDVLPREMNVRENSRTLASLQAQAVAARSYADYRYRLIGSMNNSVEFQVFIPNAYELYDPSASLLILEAVTSTRGQYLSRDGVAIDAQFGSDSINRTATCLNADYTQCHPYLIKVEDPISAWQLPEPLCDAKNNGNATVDDPATTDVDERGKVWGMSQRGAIRWSKGNNCAAEGNSIPWPVTWSDYRQILVHYYTGVDIVDDASGNKVAPDDRWNLLWHNIPTQVNSGKAFQANVWLQNTSALDWTGANMAVLGYQWIDSQSGASPWTEIALPDTPKGDDQNIPLTFTPPSVGGTYTLRLDVRRQSGGWFSEGGWPDAEISVNVTGATATPTQVITAYFYDPVNPYCVGFIGYSCTPSGYNTVVSPVRNEQSLQAHDPSSGNYTGGGRVETTIKVGGAGIGTVRVYYALNGVSCTAGHSLDIAKVSGNITNPGVPLSGYLDVNLTASDLGGFTIYTRCHSSKGYVGDFGINSLWYSLIPDVPTPTPVPATQTAIALTPTSTATPTQTPTPTQPPPSPTPTPCPCIFWCSRSASLVQAAFLASAPGSSLSYRLAQLADLTEFAPLLYRVRDELLAQTPEGQRYTALYEAHSAEIAAILLGDDALYQQGYDTLRSFEPGLQALLDGEGEAVSVTAEQVAAAQAFLDALLAEASPALQEAIQAERARRPLETMVGMTMQQAWAYLNGYTLTWLPPISTADPYEARAGSTIPVQFALANLNGEFVQDETVRLQVVDEAGRVVLGPFGLGDNPTQGIVIQGEKYHLDLRTKDLQPGDYTVEVFYNAAQPGEPAIWTLVLKKK